VIASVFAMSDLTSAIGGAVVLAALPLLAIAATSFIKIAVVLAILRQALGAPSVPPTSVLTALAAVLSYFVMAPVASDVLLALATLPQAGTDALGLGTARSTLDVAVPPIVEFLRANTPDDEVAFFCDLAGTSCGPEPSLRFLLPAFVLTEIGKAFMIGCLAYLPFLVVDLLVSASLLAMGMTSLSPHSVALPLKLLLFVAVDGWRLLFSALLVGYEV
jgi:type III secretory pathway component EscR